MTPEEHERLREENQTLRHAVATLAYCASDRDCDGCPVNGKAFDPDAPLEELGLCSSIAETVRELTRP